MRRSMGFDWPGVIMLGIAAIITPFGWGCIGALLLVIAALIRAFLPFTTARFNEAQRLKYGGQQIIRRFQQWRWRQSGRWRQMRNRHRSGQQTDYAVIPCPRCGQRLRVPAHRGKLRITCRRCGSVFEHRT